MKYLDLTVLFHDSMPSRIYLSILHQNGYCPKKIIYLKFRRGAKYNLAKKIIGERLLNKIIEKRKSKFIDTNFANIFLEKFNLSYDLLNKDIKVYSKEYVELAVSNLQDENLISYLKNEENKTFLFTGGGILRQEILSIKDSKFIHIHPGIVPDVKGSNGLFWSYLLRGKAGYSCFYMNEGIDTGDILQKDEYQLHKFKYIDLSKYKNEEIYRYMLHYYDPCFRAQTLVNLIKTSERSNQKLNQLNYEVQNPDEGRTYFLMHKKLRDFTLDKMIKEMFD
jgi:folate-dependent phosphoribosylglycinamide formyltransferase PurN